MHKKPLYKERQEYNLSYLNENKDLFHLKTENKELK